MCPRRKSRKKRTEQGHDSLFKLLNYKSLTRRRWGTASAVLVHPRPGWSWPKSERGTSPLLASLAARFYYLSNKKFLAGRTIGFSCDRYKNPGMSIHRSSHCGISLRRYAGAISYLLLFAAISSADTPGSLRGGVHAAACACNCNEGRTHVGCSKVCDSARRAARWGATTCAKPRLRKPADNNGAGPRLPHPPRAERASR